MVFNDGQISVEELAEQGVIAGVLVDPSVVDAVLAVVDSSCFREPANETIFAVIERMRETRQPITVVGLAHVLRDEGKLHSVGGVRYLEELTSPDAMYALWADVEQYALLVKENAMRRRVTSVLRAGHSRISEGGSSQEVMGLVNNQIRDLVESSSTGSGVVRVGGEIDSVFDRIRARGEHRGVNGVGTGLADLDRLTTGWLPGQFIILAARPAVGKSTLALDFCRAASVMDDKSVLFFSLEMSREEIQDKVLAAEGNVLHERIRTGRLDSGDWVALERARERLSGASLFIDDSPNINLQSIRLACMKQANSSAGLDLVVVDYLQLMSSGRKVESRQQEVSEFSRGLKLLAKEFGVPVIALSQLNRGIEKRSDRMPQMSDLRESGSLEQDADIVLLLYRPGVDEDTLDDPELIVAKNRGGATGKVGLTSLLEYSKFGARSGEVPPPLDDESVPFDDGAEGFVAFEGGVVDRATGEVMDVPVPDEDGREHYAGPAW